MISYAQNLEDVMLNRAFHDIENGFYIDVGAWHPDIDSVTRHFYEKGWCGINVEPVDEYAQLLRDKRPRDVTLNIALGTAPGRMRLYVVPGTGLSSGRLQNAEEAGRSGYERHDREVEVTTLKAVCDKHSAGRTIHFLKIDAEGMETDIIRGMDWCLYRPYIVVIEAVRPNSQIPTWDEWDHLLVENNYRFVWFDGINRFYVRNENPELCRYFSVPPNPFDNFQLAKVTELEKQIAATTETPCARFMLGICAWLGKLRNWYRRLSSTNQQER